MISLHVVWISQYSVDASLWTTTAGVVHYCAAGAVLSVRILERM